MGATTFQEYGLGRTAQGTFSHLVREAQYEYGHDIYAGTIGTKSGFVSMGQIPSTVLTKNIFTPVRWFYETTWEWADDDVPQVGAPYGGGLATSTEGRLDLSKVPAKYRELVRKHYDIWDDKWGPAVCYEVTGTKARELKRSHRRQGTQDKVFVFFGHAPC